MKKNKLMMSLSLLTAIFLMASCSNSKSAHTDAGSIYKEWKLTEVKGQPVPSTSEAGLVIGSDNKISGSTGCNLITGSAEIENAGNIKFSPLGTTRMACPEEINNIETHFLEALSAAKSWKIEDGMLLLSDGITLLAKLSAKKQPTAEQAKLNGTWELNYITGPRIAFEGLYPDKKPVIIFNLPDTIASGNSSCNHFSIPFELKGMKIKFGEGLSTLMACEGEGETVFLQTLQKVNSYSLSDDNKTLSFIMDDIAVMRFTKR